MGGKEKKKGGEKEGRRKRGKEKKKRGEGNWREQSHAFHQLEITLQLTTVVCLIFTLIFAISTVSSITTSDSLVYPVELKKKKQKTLKC